VVSDRISYTGIWFIDSDYFTAILGTGGLLLAIAAFTPVIGDVYLAD
jgi:hypothetical protein